MGFFGIYLKSLPIAFIVRVILELLVLIKFLKKDLIISEKQKRIIIVLIAIVLVSFLFGKFTLHHLESNAIDAIGNYTEYEKHVSEAQIKRNQSEKLIYIITVLYIVVSAISMVFIIIYIVL